MKQYFYTIMQGEKFLPDNLMQGMTNNIINAIKFYSEENAKDYFEDLRKDKGFEIKEVECIIREY